MDDLVAYILFIGIAIIGVGVGAVLGWVSFFRTGEHSEALRRASADIASLRAEVGALTAQLRGVAEQMPSAADWSADTPKPVPLTEDGHAPDAGDAEPAG
ncbi:MAG: hypothetical protein MI723_03845, partial [Caulobacterales bacterium]|nr:hypothetical protein [Caulobacterales bacterium]